jgi:uncharacterized protein YutE (UPF0331/DUF86 family)
MTGFDRATLAERASVVERHLRRVRERLPEDAQDLRPATDASDAVVLHLWQAVQVTIDVAIGLCVSLGLGTPATYGDAFRTLAEHGHLEHDLADRLARAAGFRNLLVHAYADLDLTRVHAAAGQGPADLRDFFAAASDLV